MNAAELIEFLQDFYRDRLGSYLRHEAGARSADSYRLNNACQYVLAREEAHLQWIADAIRAAGGAVPERLDGPIVPEGAGAVPGGDARQELAMADRWRERIGAVTNARDRRLLEIVLGEMVEHRSLLERAARGDADPSGRNPRGAGGRGRVRASRALE